MKGLTLPSGNKHEYSQIIKNLCNLDLDFDFYIHPKYKQLIIYFDNSEIKKLPLYDNKHFIPLNKNFTDGYSLRNITKHDIKEFKKTR